MARGVQTFRPVQRKRNLRSSFVVTVGAASAVLGACGGVETGSSPSTSGGNSPDCPATLPQAKSPCSVKVECDYSFGSQCSSQHTKCIGGNWGWFVDPGLECPASAPKDGSPCDCYPEGFGCGQYVDPYGCSGQWAQNVSVECKAGTWKHSVGSCNPPSPPDAGPLPDASAVDAAIDGAIDAAVTD